MLCPGVHAHKGEHEAMSIQTIIMRTTTNSMQAISNLLRGPHIPPYVLNGLRFCRSVMEVGSVAIFSLVSLCPHPRLFWPAMAVYIYGYI
jgi:hypothetical protein